MVCFCCKLQPISTWTELRTSKARIKSRMYVGSFTPKYLDLPPILHHRIASHKFNRHKCKPLIAIHTHSHFPILSILLNYYPPLSFVLLSQLLATNYSNNYVNRSPTTTAHPFYLLRSSSILSLFCQFLTFVLSNCCCIPSHLLIPFTWCATSYLAVLLSLLFTNTPQLTATKALAALLANCSPSSFQRPSARARRTCGQLRYRSYARPASSAVRPVSLASMARAASRQLLNTRPPLASRHPSLQQYVTWHLWLTESVI